MFDQVSFNNAKVRFPMFHCVCFFCNFFSVCSLPVFFYQCTSRMKSNDTQDLLHSSRKIIKELNKKKEELNQKSDNQSGIAIAFHTKFETVEM